MMSYIFPQAMFPMWVGNAYVRGHWQCTQDAWLPAAYGCADIKVAGNFCVLNADEAGNKELLANYAIKGVPSFVLIK